MKELLIEVKNKGFKPKTFTTIHTLEHYTGVKSRPLITEMCDYLILCEIRRWFINEHKLFITISYGYGWEVTIGGYHDGTFESDKEALKTGIQEALKLI